ASNLPPIQKSSLRCVALMRQIAEVATLDHVMRSNSKLRAAPPLILITSEGNVPGRAPPSACAGNSLVWRHIDRLSNVFCAHRFKAEAQRARNSEDWRSFPQGQVLYLPHSLDE